MAAMTEDDILNDDLDFILSQVAEEMWSRARPRSVYQHIHEIKSILNITCDTPGRIVRYPNSSVFQR
jgi:hypothetical protein